MTRQEQRAIAAAALAEILDHQKHSLPDDVMCFLIIEQVILEAYSKGMIDGIQKLGDRLKENGAKA